MNKDPISEPENASGQEEEQDFAALLEASTRGKDRRVQQDSQVTGTVVSVSDEWVFIDLGGKSEGVIAREELADESGSTTIGPGDPVTAYVVSTRDGEIRLSVKMTVAASEEALRDAYHSGVPVEGVVSAERKGGFSISLLGKQAFCPYSQIDIVSGGAAADYVGRRLTFRVTEYSERGRNIVVSRREVLEEERLKQMEELKKTLKSGDLVRGTVRALAQFGAFVDLGGVDGLIPMSELAWHRIADASEVLSPGDSVTVQIMNLDWANNRISLSLKRTMDDPWNSVDERYQQESVVSGTVTRLQNFGAFVELEPGIEGLIHISNLSTGRRVNHPKEVLSSGDRVDVKVLTTDKGARRIGLELIPSGFDESGEVYPELVAGSVITGTVDAVKDYGLFVRLPGGKSGLLHVSQIGDGKTGDLKKRFPDGSAIEVEILSIDPETKKVSLSTKSLRQKTEESQFTEFSASKGGKPSLGTLGDLLKDKKK